VQSGLLYGEANRCRHLFASNYRKCFWRQWHTTAAALSS
jgi:hypothetical protein